MYALQEQLQAAAQLRPFVREAGRRRAIPIPWAPPMPEIDWLRYPPYRRLVAEATVDRLRSVLPALYWVDWRWGAMVQDLIAMLEAAAAAPVTPRRAA